LCCAEDNFFYGERFQQLLTDVVNAFKQDNKAVVFEYSVDGPERFGVA